VISSVVGVIAFLAALSVAAVGFLAGRGAFSIPGAL
jgi:hypothetical protein